MKTQIHVCEKIIHSCICLLLITPLLYASMTYATSVFLQGTAGYDISYPQCNKELPTSAAFVIVGVNGGRPFTENYCFKQQTEWAKNLAASLSVYQNLSYITLRTAQYTFDGPQTCTNNEPICLAYNQGYQLSSYTTEIVKRHEITPRMWWLDIETMNTWSEDTLLNAAIIQGAIDYHKEQNHHVGIYSNQRQWRIIAGNYAPQLPIWIAGARNEEDARNRCSSQYSFAGGMPYMVQYIKDNLDNNVLCSGISTLVFSTQ